MINRNQLVMNNFNCAASQYLANAQIQRSPALKIIDHLSKYYCEGMILDLGSGPGTLAHNNLLNYPITAFDISLNMLKTGTACHKVNGDAGNLPFTTNSFPIIISNLMLQWPENKEQVINEAYRVLKPNGKFILTTLIKSSLEELQSSWLQVDNKPHTLELLTQNTYLELLKNSGFKLHQSISWREVVYFPNLNALLRHFKATGTSLAKSVSNVGLGGKEKLWELNKAYQQLATQNGLLPLSYVYLLIIASKESN